MYEWIKGLMILLVFGTILGIGIYQMYLDTKEKTK